MNNQLVQRENTSLVFSMPNNGQMGELVSFCKVMATAPFYQKIGAGGIMAIYLTSKELNLPFMACLNGGLYTFDGKVTMSAQLMHMMIVNAGHRADIIELNESVCEINFVRNDRKNHDYIGFKYKYTIEMAKSAGYLTKDNWKKHPRDMLFSRCLSGGARKHLPDVLMNSYVFGEIDESDSHLTNTMPSEVLEIKAPDPLTIEQINILNQYIQSDKNPTQVTEKLLKNANAISVETITQDKFDKAIQWIVKRQESQIEKIEEKETYATV